MARALWRHLAGDPTFGRRLVLTAATRQGSVFLWGLRMPQEGKQPDWVSIPLTAAKSAETRWTKLFFDMALKRHRIKVSEHLTDEPVWPKEPLSELLRLAFQDRLVTSLDDPILKRLRGEA